MQLVDLSMVLTLAAYLSLFVNGLKIYDGEIAASSTKTAGKTGLQSAKN
jgi:hypothetical protein